MIIELDKKELPLTCYVFKHSTRCPISTNAAEVVKSVANSLKTPLYWINVIEQRDLSNWIAEEYKAQHQSPQLLKIENGVVVKNTTHQGIKEDVF